MSDIKILNTGKTWVHVSVGPLKSFEGKQFVKEATGADSCEISFGSLPSGAAVPFFHSHKANEENYIILSGSGEYQDGRLSVCPDIYILTDSRLNCCGPDFQVPPAHSSGVGRAPVLTPQAPFRQPHRRPLHKPHKTQD